MSVCMHLFIHTYMYVNVHVCVCVCVCVCVRIHTFVYMYPLCEMVCQPSCSFLIDKCHVLISSQYGMKHGTVLYIVMCKIGGTECIVSGFHLPPSLLCPPMSLTSPHLL